MMLASKSHIALVDEIEHGLEPHRIARLLKFLASPPDGGPRPQVFMTTHSPVVIRELTASDIFSVQSKEGVTTVLSVADTAKDLDAAQRHLRSNPEAFLARRIVVGEGRTEQGLVRGLDTHWCSNGLESFAFRGVGVVEGNGIGSAPIIADHLCTLGYSVFVLLDSDKPADSNLVARLRSRGVFIHEWPDSCSTEERIFLDVPWKAVCALVKFAEEKIGYDSVVACINNSCRERGISVVADLSLPVSLDTKDFRGVLGFTAKEKDWFKDITRGERVAQILANALGEIQTSPAAIGISILRKWVDD